VQWTSWTRKFLRAAEFSVNSTLRLNSAPSLISSAVLDIVLPLTIDNSSTESQSLHVWSIQGEPPL